jgi:hypothetical protein
MRRAAWRRPYHDGAAAIARLSSAIMAAAFSATYSPPRSDWPVIVVGITEAGQKPLVTSAFEKRVHIPGGQHVVGIHSED